MTRDEVANLLELNMANYPGRFLKNATTKQLRAMANSWLAVFGDIDGKLVLAAYMEALKHCQYPVTIADSWKQLEETQPELNPEKEWRALIKAADWCYSHSDYLHYDGPSHKYEGLTQAEEYQRDCKLLFDSLSDVNKAFIGNRGRLLELGRRDDREQDFWFAQRYRPAFERYQREEKGQRILALAASDIKMIGA